MNRNLTELSADEKRILVLALGIVSMEAAMRAGTLEDRVLRAMDARVEKSKGEYNSRMLRINYPSLVKRLEAIE